MNNVTATLHATLTVNIARYMPVVADVQQEWAVGVRDGPRCVNNPWAAWSRVVISLERVLSSFSI
jgi:hypothetical protein